MFFEIISNPKFLLAIFILIIVFIVIVYKSTKGDIDKVIAIGTLIGGITAIGVLFVLVYQANQLNRSIELQTNNIKVQIDNFNLEKRPYLWIELKDHMMALGEDRTSIFGGGTLYFKNEGEIPASDITAKYRVMSDVVPTDELEKWFEKARGGFPHVRTVFPNQSDLYVSIHPTVGYVSMIPKLIFIDALITYTGKDKKKKYWYKAEWLYGIKIKKFEVVKEKEQEKIKEFEASFFLLKTYTDWDRNTNFEIPELKKPVWDSYLSLIKK